MLAVQRHCQVEILGLSKDAEWGPEVPGEDGGLATASVKKESSSFMRKHFEGLFQRTPSSGNNQTYPRRKREGLRGLHSFGCSTVFN